MQDLRQVGRDQHDRRARLAQIADEGVDRDARADIDADRRLVEDEHFDRRGSGILASSTFCWLPPEKMSTSRSMSKRLEVHAARQARRPCALSPPRSRKMPRRRRPDASAGSAMFSRQERHHHQPLLAPVGRQVEEAAVEHAARGVAPVTSSPLKRDPARGDRLDAEAGARRPRTCPSRPGRRGRRSRRRAPRCETSRDGAVAASVRRSIAQQLLAGRVADLREDLARSTRPVISSDQLVVVARSSASSVAT